MVTRRLNLQRSSATLNRQLKLLRGMNCRMFFEKGRNLEIDFGLHRSQLEGIKLGGKNE